MMGESTAGDNFKEKNWKGKQEEAMCGPKVIPD